jgi:predicted amidohydrolase
MPSACFAVVQMTTTDDRAANRACADRWIREAADRGAQVVCLPEMWAFIGSDAEKLKGAETLDGPTMTFARELAAELGIWLFPGSFAERGPEPGRVYNCAPAIDSAGEIRALYRKVHLFDIAIPGGAVFAESDTVAPGDRAVIVDTPFGRLGMTVCYDLRFPGLYTALRDGGADAVLVPAAFTAHTGKAHWEVLLRARAIEQQLWVLAPDQTGWHSSKRESHGHSVVIDPWGDVVARCSAGPGIALAWVDLDRVRTVREQLPCRSHRRDFQRP